MTLIVCSSDFHGDAETLGVPRFQEVEQAARQSVSYAIENKASYYFFLGDLADPETGGSTFASIALVIELAIDLAKAKIVSLWLTGNHCVADTGEGESVLTPLRGLAKAFPQVRLINRPTLFVDGENGLRIVALPFTSPSHGYDPAEFCRKAKVDENTIVLSHLMIPGIHAGSETTDLPRGREIVFPAKETSKAKLRLFGHYHRRQKFDLKDGGVSAFVVGSLCRLGFGEEGNDPGFICIEV